METQKIPNNQSSPEKEDGGGGINLPDFNYSHQDSMVLAQKQKYRPTEQDRKPRNKLMHPWVLYF